MERKEFLKKGFTTCGLAVLSASLLESCKKEQSSYTGPTNVNFALDLSNPSYAALNNAGG